MERETSDAIRLSPGAAVTASTLVVMEEQR